MVAIVGSRSAQSLPGPHLHCVSEVVGECAGCCNPEMRAFSGGESVALADIVREVDDAAACDAGEGITLLGGEPLAHAAGAAALARALRRHGLSVMVFTGYTLEEARALPD